MSNLSNLVTGRLTYPGANRPNFATIGDINNYVYVDLVTLATAIDAIDTGTITLTVVETGDGTASLPSHTFTSETNTGFYRIGSHNVGLTLNGTKSVDFAVNLMALTGAFTASTSITAGSIFSSAAGSAGAPGITFTGQTDMGAYKISSTQLGISVGGALVAFFNGSGLATGTITEQVAGAGVNIAKAIISNHTTFAVNSDATVAAANFNKGYFTSTSAAGTTLTLDTCAHIATQLGAVAGTVFDFWVDCVAGSNTVTVAVNTGITAAKQVSAGDTASDVLLVVTNGTATGIGHFQLVFTSAAAAVLYRVG